MNSASVPVRQQGKTWWETVVGDGFAETLRGGLDRSHYARVARDRCDDTAPRAGTAAALSELPRDVMSEDADRAWLEQRRLAREMHDELGTALSSVAHRMELHAAATETTGGTGESLHLAAARQALQQAMDIARHLTGTLQHWTVLPPLADALRDFVASTAPASVEVQIRTTGDERLLSDICRRELFLVVREALRNAFQHSGAGQVTAVMRFTRRWAHVGITDDGAGFDVDEYLTPGHRSQGLRSMTDRMDDIGGRLGVESAPGAGTRVDVHLPLRPGPRS